MSLFLETAGVSTTAFNNLLTISGQDGGLGLTDVVGDSTLMQVTYNETPGKPATADRLNTLVNTDFGIRIIITALNGGNDPHSGLDITGNGVTFTDSSSGTTVIRVVYDVSQCCGQGLFGFDTAGNHITTPNPVILYHELSHALHGATGTQQPNDEPPAETDENVMRTELGLCQRDVNNHDGGCGGGDNCGGSDGGADGGPPAGGCAGGIDGGCFIVTAATGSPESVEVCRLRQLRERVVAESGLSAQLIDRIYGEYYQFSPAIAAELEQDSIARMAVLWIVVRPLVAWYTLAGTLALDHPNQTAVDQAVQDVFNACPRDLGGASIAALLETIHTGAPLPPNSPERLRAFVPRFQEAVRHRFASWAILDPLVRAWVSSVGGLDVVESVAQWLATAPLESLAAPSDPTLLDAEIGVLASFYGFKATARQQIGARLALAWPDAAEALRRHGFV